jgi:hypothetical protein
MTTATKPADALYLEGVADVIGVELRTASSYRARRRLPEPDGYDNDRGHARPWWARDRILAWDAARPGSGNWRKPQQTDHDRN